MPVGPPDPKSEPDPAPLLPLVAEARAWPESSRLLDGRLVRDGELGNTRMQILVPGGGHSIHATKARLSSSFCILASCAIAFLAPGPAERPPPPSPRVPCATGHNRIATLPVALKEAEPLEDAVEHAKIATVVNDEPARAGVEAGRAAKRLGQLPLQAADVGIGGLRTSVLRASTRPPPHEPFGRAYRETVSEDPLRHPLLAPGVAERHERTRMAWGKLSGRDVLQDPLRKLQQAKRVGDVAPRAPALARKPGDCTVAPQTGGPPPRKLRFELSGLLDGIGALAAARKAQDLACFRIVNLVPQLDWNLEPAPALRGKPCLGVGQDLEPTRSSAYDDRIDRPVRFDEPRERRRNLWQRTGWPKRTEMELLDAGPVRHSFTVVRP